MTGAENGWEDDGGWVSAAGKASPARGGEPGLPPKVGFLNLRSTDSGMKQMTPHFNCCYAAGHAPTAVFVLWRGSIRPEDLV